MFQKCLILSLAITLLGMDSSAGYGQDPNDSANRPAVISRGGSSRVGFPPLNPIKTDRVVSDSRSNYQVTDPDRIAAAGQPIAAAGQPIAAVGQPIVLDQAADEGLALEASPDPSRSKMTGPLVTVCSSLAIVLALFSGLVWAGRKFGGASAASKPLPASALTPLGHIMLDPRTKLMLVKCGRRILVLSQTASGVTPITEVTHPDEVRELIANCSAEAREVFQRTLREIEMEPASGFTAADEDRPTPRQPARKGSRLFATA